MNPRLSTRRARIARVNAKRPQGHVEIDLGVSPTPGARGELVDLLLELLEQHRQSGAR